MLPYLLRFKVLPAAADDRPGFGRVAQFALFTRPSGSLPPPSQSVISDRTGAVGAIGVAGKLPSASRTWLTASSATLRLALSTTSHPCSRSR